MAVRRTPRALHTLVRVDGAAVTLQIPGASSPVSLSAVWLLDHARESRHAATRQREFLASSREDVPRIVDARVADGALHVVWSGAPEMAACTTTHTLAHLDALEHGAPARAPASWSAGVFARGDAPLSTASEMLADDGLGRALAKLRAFGMLRIDAMPSSVQATREIAMRIGPPRETYYGGMWSTRAAPGDTAGVNDTAYLDVAIRPHTDGTYFHDPPGLQVLNCVSQAERGGETLVVDAVGVLDALRAAAPATIAFFAQTRLPWYSYDADTRSGLPVRLSTREPVLRLDGGVGGSSSGSTSTTGAACRPASGTSAPSCRTGGGWSRRSTARSTSSGSASPRASASSSTTSACCTAEPRSRAACARWSGATSAGTSTRAGCARSGSSRCRADRARVVWHRDRMR
jgi:hypothetical protein